MEEVARGLVVVRQGLVGQLDDWIALLQHDMADLLLVFADEGADQHPAMASSKDAVVHIAPPLLRREPAAHMHHMQRIVQQQQVTHRREAVLPYPHSLLDVEIARMVPAYIQPARVVRHIAQHIL